MPNADLMAQGSALTRNVASGASAPSEGPPGLATLRVGLMGRSDCFNMKSYIFIIGRLPFGCLNAVSILPCVFVCLAVLVMFAGFSYLWS